MKKHGHNYVDEPILNSPNKGMSMGVVRTPKEEIDLS
jgi:hypothetical protein